MNSNDENSPERLFKQLMAAFVRGRFAQGDAIALSSELVRLDLYELSELQLSEIYREGIQFGLRLSKFKRNMELARVNKVLGILRSIAPVNLLDVGSGRGSFLWPLLDTFPDLQVTSVDHDEQRSSDLAAVNLGGIDRLKAYQMDATALTFPDRHFDVVTLLEVLEHICEFRTVIRDAVRIARRFVIISVPSKPDNNPEHIHLLTKDVLQDALERVGCRRVQFDAVLNHLLAIATVA